MIQRQIKLLEVLTITEPFQNQHKLRFSLRKLVFTGNKR